MSFRIWKGRHHFYGSSGGGRREVYGVNLLSKKPYPKRKALFILCLFQPRKLGHVSHPKWFHNPMTERSQLGGCMGWYNTAGITKPDSGKHPTEVWFSTVGEGLCAVAKCVCKCECVCSLGYFLGKLFTITLLRFWTLLSRESRLLFCHLARWSYMSWRRAKDLAAWAARSSRGDSIQGRAMETPCWSVKQGSSSPFFPLCHKWIKVQRGQTPSAT